MPKIESARDIEYLAFEGGGGKGVAFLGAVKALEDLLVLPISPSRNQIKGISGASAGAISAMFLALGLGSAELRDILHGRKTFNNITFSNFFDNPHHGRRRAVQIGARTTRAISESYTVNMQGNDAVIFATMSGMFREFIRALNHIHRNNPLLAKLQTNSERYFANLLFGKGLFPGFAVRTFLKTAMQEYIIRILANRRVLITNDTGINVTFQQFYDITGVDLIFTATNITANKPDIFSRQHSPNFLVVEAVAISMNLPFVFKPVLIWGSDRYSGLWVDGGLLNNFPLHAFDFDAPSCHNLRGVKPLHPKMLGIRLAEGAPNQTTPTSYTQQTDRSIYEPIKSLIFNIFATSRYPAEDGQIRTQDERSQTIDLYTYDLGTFDFAPNDATSRVPIQQAESSLKRYFNRP